MHYLHFEYAVVSDVADVVGLDLTTLAKSTNSLGFVKSRDYLLALPITVRNSDEGGNFQILEAQSIRGANPISQFINVNIRKESVGCIEFVLKCNVRYDALLERPSPTIELTFWPLFFDCTHHAAKELLHLLMLTCRPSLVWWVILYGDCGAVCSRWPQCRKAAFCENVDGSRCAAMRQRWIGHRKKQVIHASHALSTLSAHLVSCRKRQQQSDNRVQLSNFLAISNDKYSPHFAYVGLTHGVLLKQCHSNVLALVHYRSDVILCFPILSSETS